ncbi:MAG: hypothetical protein ACQ9CV_00260 [Nitrosopumilus sp.]|jgi:hypothetical protein
MSSNDKFESDFLAMSELTKEISFIVKNNIDQGNSDLIDLDIEHILKITSDVTHKIKSQLRELTA